MSLRAILPQLSSVKWGKGCQVLVLALLVCLAFGRSVFGTFHYDDSHSITDNVSVHSLRNIPAFWTDATTSSFVIENRTYRPLTYTFFAVCWAIGAGSPVPFLALKLFLHFIMVWMVFLIWRRMTSFHGWFPLGLGEVRFPYSRISFTLSPDNTAFILAGIFAIHPACAECINYIVATSSLQCAVFYAGAYLSYLVFRESKGLRHLVLSLFLFFCSVASKEEGVTLPVMVLATELFLDARPFAARIKTALKVVLPYGVLALMLALWLYRMHPVEGDLSRGTMGVMPYFMTQWRAYLWYMKLWFWPGDLNADNLSFEFSQSFFDLAVMGALLGNILLLLLAWRLRFKYPFFLFGLVWFFVTISPASSVVPLGEAVNEHRMYLAYLGFSGGSFLLLLKLLEGFLGARRFSQTMPFLFMLVFVALLVGAQNRTSVWASEKSLWIDTVAKNPNSPRALNNLALAWSQEGRTDKALELVDHCVKFWKTYMYCALNRGITYLSLLEQSEGIATPQEIEILSSQAKLSLENAQSLNPKSVYANYHLARFFQEAKSDCASAVAFYEKAIQLNGNRFPTAQAKVSGCYRKLGLKTQAELALSSAYRLEPNNEAVLCAMGEAEQEKKHFEGALNYYQRLISTLPSRSVGYKGGALVELKQKKYASAVFFLLRWHAIAPRSPQPLIYLGFAARKIGDLQALPELERRYLSLNSRLTRDRFNEAVERLEGVF